MFRGNTQHYSDAVCQQCYILSAEGQDCACRHGATELLCCWWRSSHVAQRLQPGELWLSLLLSHETSFKSQLETQFCDLTWLTGDLTKWFKTYLRLAIRDLWFDMTYWRLNKTGNLTGTWDLLLETCDLTSSRMRFMSHNWSATKQRLHPWLDLNPTIPSVTICKFIFITDFARTVWQLSWSWSWMPPVLRVQSLAVLVLVLRVHSSSHHWQSWYSSWVSPVLRVQSLSHHLQ